MCACHNFRHVDENYLHVCLGIRSGYQIFFTAPSKTCEIYYATSLIACIVCISAIFGALLMKWSFMDLHEEIGKPLKVLATSQPCSCTCRFQYLKTPSTPSLHRLGVEGECNY